MDWFIALSVLVLTGAMDYLHVIYTRYVVKHKAIQAATSGAVIYLISAYAVISYVDDPRYLVFVVLGSWLGTYLSIRFARKETDNV
jgi:uncharacterized membrane protein YfcA